MFVLKQKYFKVFIGLCLALNLAHNGHTMEKDDKRPNSALPRLIVHNVGEGNFVEVAVPLKDSLPSYMFIDMGGSAPRKVIYKSEKSDQEQEREPPEGDGCPEE